MDEEKKDVEVVVVEVGKPEADTEDPGLSEKEAIVEAIMTKAMEMAKDRVPELRCATIFYNIKRKTTSQTSLLGRGGLLAQAFTIYKMLKTNELGMVMQMALDKDGPLGQMSEERKEKAMLKLMIESAAELARHAGKI